MVNLLFALLAIIIIAFLLLLFSLHRKNNAIRNEQKRLLREIPEISKPDDETWRWSHNTAHFKIRGVGHYDPKEGHHEAYLISEINNPYDPEAILVIDKDKSPIGHLPRGNGYLYREISQKHDRYLPVNVMINEAEEGDERIVYGFADICLETYPDLDVRKMITGFE